MAKRTPRKRSNTRTAQAAPQSELREELALRRYLAKTALKQAKAADAALATYSAAKRDRRNHDWANLRGISADAAIIPDSETLNARARQMERDSWIVRSTVKAWARNVVGCGIIPVPTPKDKDGRLLKDLAKSAMLQFWRWAQDKHASDVEKRQTFWAKQRLAESERVIVGESFILWSYDGAGDNVGLKLQSFEPEQLDRSINSYNGNEVRGGVEIDSNGAAIAYHFYTHNPNDYTWVRSQYRSVRIDASRVFHYYLQERVQQTRGVTALAAVLQDARDFNRYKEAILWRAIMEACIGVLIKSANPSGGPLTLGRAAGDDGVTGSGMSTVDFVPGMVGRLAPGEDVSPFAIQSPGNQYAPFTEVTLRGIGAGAGLSYGQLARRSEGNYSAARQDMLEDRKEFEPVQELMAHSVVLPIYQLWFGLAVAEGRFDDVAGFSREDYATAPWRYKDAEYVAPAQPWIDPEKEINAYTKAIDYRLRSRQEIIALSGQRIEDVWDAVESEQNDAKARGIALPENLSTEQLAVDTITAEAAATAAEATKAQAEAEPEPELTSAPARPLSRKLRLAEAVDLPPVYRDATGDARRCATCSMYSDGKCSIYELTVEPHMTCDEWQALPPAETIHGSRNGTPPGPTDGEEPIDHPHSDFNDNREYLAAKYSGIDFTPPEGMREAARNGVERHEAGESGDGLKPETVSRANRIASGAALTPEHVREMAGWFARHESTKPEGDPIPSPWYTAWQLWGGDAGRTWSQKVAEQMDREDANPK